MQSNTSDVHVGRNGWLFLTGGSNQVLRYFTEADFFSVDHRRGWHNLLRSRTERAAEIGAQYCHVIAPEKLSVYPEYYVGTLPFMSSAPTRGLFLDDDYQVAETALVDLLPAFERLKGEGRSLYFKTDTHWTHEAANVAAAEVCRKLGVSYSLQYQERPLGQADLVLDLGGKLSPPVSERWEMRRSGGNLERIHVNEIVAYKEANGLENDPGLHVGSGVVFRNRTPTVSGRILIFGDSFSEYRDHLLTGALAETFEETHFVWSSQLDWSYIARLEPKFIVTESAERFMRSIPSVDIDLAAFCRDRLADFRRSRA